MDILIDLLFLYEPFLAILYFWVYNFIILLIKTSTFVLYSIDRWIVNYIRHKLTDYEKELEKINGRYGEIEAREKYRYLLAEQMKKTYPELIKAIQINMLNSTSNIVE